MHKGRPRRHLLTALAFMSAILLPAVMLSAASEPQCEWRDVARVVAIGDLHGDWDNFVLILKGTGLVDDRLHWKAGNTHLVQLGDIMDRGPDARKIMDRLMKLEEEAARAGGMVHVLLGNHEEMNITGISLEYPDYVTVEQFVSFLPSDYREWRESRYFETLRDRRMPAPLVGSVDISNDRGLRDFWSETMRTDNDAKAAYVRGFNDKYGEWLMKKNTVIRLNDTIFVHGGISEKLSAMPIAEINRLMRKELREYRARMAKPRRYPAVFRPMFIYDPDSPLWYRGLAVRNEARAQAEVDRILGNLKARAMVIGHNYMQGSGTSPIVSLDMVAHFRGEVFIMDTGISRSYGGAVAALIINGRDAYSIWSASAEALARTASAQPAGHEGPEPVRDLEAFLNEAAVTGIDRAGTGGRTEPWKISLALDGMRGRAFFRYIDRRRPALLPDSYKYEIAAYLLSRHLGLGLVPVTVERTVGGQKGALQAFVENVVPMNEVVDKKPDLLVKQPIAKSIENIKVFSLLTGDRCLRQSDILINPVSEEVRLTDFTQAFSPDRDLSAGCEIRGCSRFLYDALKNWDEDAVHSLLDGLLNDSEIAGVNRRRGLLIKEIEEEIASFGEKAVLFD